MEEVVLSGQEIRDLVDYLMEAVDFLEEDEAPRATWVREVQEWCATMLGRLHGITDEGGDAT